MNEKERFAVLASTGQQTIKDLCRDFGISRKTGHKYLERYRRLGREGLAEMSRRHVVRVGRAGRLVHTECLVG